jgi:molybdate transport system substrate-binding protein
MWIAFVRRVTRLFVSFAVLLGGLTLAVVPSAAQSPSALPSCPPGPTASAGPVASGEQSDLTVFAAASLSKAFEDMQEPWCAAQPGSQLITSFDASSALRTQIEEGAPVDVFASADIRNARKLVDECLAPGPITPFAGNTLVIVVPTGNPAGIASPADIARSGVRVVAAGPEVPITRYTTQAIQNLGALEGYPADFAAAVTANTVSEEDNVRAVLTKIELGEGDAAIVYVTDAASSDQVETVAIPDEANVPATYAAVTIGSAAQPALAAEFLEFVTGVEGQSVLVGHGFLPVGVEASQQPSPIS